MSGIKEGKKKERKNRGALFTYFRSHIWIEIFVSMLLVTIVMLSVFFIFLQNRYYNSVIYETEKADKAILSAAVNGMNNTFSEQLHVDGEIAVNDTLYNIVHDSLTEENMTISDSLELKRELSTIAVYSDAIASIAIVSERGLISEYARHWGYDTPMLWVGDNLDSLQELYNRVMSVLPDRKPGYYVTGISPLRRTSMPEMSLYHIAFPLLGKNKSLNRVEAIVVVTYNMGLIANSSMITGDSELDYTYRYLTDSSGTIIYHEDNSLIGLSENRYLTGHDFEVSTQALDNVDIRLNIAIDRQQIRSNVRRMYTQGSIVYVLIILLVFLMWQMMIRSILKPVDIIKKNMEDVEKGRRRKIDVKGEHEIWLLAGEYNKMLDALQTQQDRVQKEYQEKMEMSELRDQAERIALESQINAHFIFNTLNAINYNAIETGSLETSHLIKRLSNILQYTLSSRAEVTLGLEFNAALEYLYLQKYRLMDKFEYDVRFPEEYSEWPCCKLFLQPFIENSIVHGFENVESGGRIWITGEAAGNRFRVEIGDNGCGMDEETSARIMSSFGESHDFALNGSGIAIRNVIARLQMFFGKNFEVRLDTAPGQGAVFLFYLPIPEKDETNSGAEI